MTAIRAERLLVFTYPLVLHFCILAGQVTVAVYWLAFLLTLMVLKALLSRRALTWWTGGLATTSVGLVWSVAAGHEAVVYLPPILINLALLVLFSRTLLPGEVPLITRLATLMDKKLSASTVSYTRSLTLVWSVYFLVMTILGVVFAVAAPLEIWSYFANCLHYVLIPLMFVVEFTVRRRVLRKEVDYGFRTFIRRLLAAFA